MSLICYKWGSTNIKWIGADWKWSECKLVEEIITEAGKPGGGAVLPDGKYPWENVWEKDEEKKKRMIRLICKVKNEEFDETKEVRDIKIKVSDVKLVVKTMTGIELSINNE